MGKNLVIVESPAKAKTINKYLGKDFLVKASMGHVRDLPKNPKKPKGKAAGRVIGGVQIEKGFAVDYEPLEKKKKVLDELKTAAKTADKIYLAGDPDREGEAICWHLAESLGVKDKKKLRRVVFHEITKKAVQAAFEHPRDIDEKKVDAQQTRRILDRLVGYGVSPILWERVRRGLSAGRVQSVALRLICEREREIRAFVAEEYWSVLAHLKAGAPPVFPANLLKRGGKPIDITNAEQAQAVRAELEAATFKVAKVAQKERKRHPVPPFITSKLQQEAFKKLRFPVKKTMQVAQKLYEGIEIGPEGSVGLITYMRTDSTRVGDDALGAVRRHVAGTYGEDFLPEKPVFYKSKSGAQDAHEAIRPTDLDKSPDAIKRYLGKDEYALYRLIWNRFVASQMRPAVYDETVVDVEAASCLLRAKGSTLRFKGFLAVYEETPDEKPEHKPAPEDKAAQADDTAPEEAGSELPPLVEGQVLSLQKLDTDQHFTQPPPRFSEATLVKELEENGIGRPSTYAQILATIEARDYVEKREGKFFPTEMGFHVIDLLIQGFADIVDVEYTAALEQELDAIEAGEDNLLNTLGQFWKKFGKDLDAFGGKKQKAAPAFVDGEVCEKCGSPMVKKWGGGGRPFLGCSAYPECKFTKKLEGEESGFPPVDPEALALRCSIHDEPMQPRSGRFGYFMACPRYPECKQTRKLIRANDVDGTLKPEPPPRPIDENCPDCGKPLAWRRGRFGPFIACSDYPSCKYIKKKEAIEIGLLCPECHEGQVVERKGRWGKSFYGCRRYPKCTFTAYHKPVAEPCPDCGRAYLLEKETKKEGRVLFCGNEECGFKKVAAAA